MIEFSTPQVGHVRIEMTPAICEVLGLMLWHTTPLGQVLRSAGASIRPKAEDEQAHALLWLLNIALEHGDDWRKVASKRLDEMVSESKAADLADRLRGDEPEADPCNA